MRLAGLQASLRWNHPDPGWLTGFEIAPAGSRRLQRSLVDCALQSALQFIRYGLKHFGGDHGALAVLRGTVTLADGLGLPTCAPGVAGGDQVAALRSVGCAMLQGPWYQPPMAAPEAGAWLAIQAVRPPPST